MNEKVTVNKSNLVFNFIATHANVPDSSRTDCSKVVGLADAVEGWQEAWA